MMKINPIEEEIKYICQQYKYTYGYRKVTSLLNKHRRKNVNHKKLQRIMREYKLNCRVRAKKSKRPGSAYYKTNNILQRNFKAKQPLEVLTTDITYLPFGKSMLYLSLIMDLHNGEIIAYSIDT